MNYAFRLTKGQDLKKSIMDFVLENNIKAGVVKSGVGCVYEARFRLANAEGFFHSKDNYEIVSLMGTVSPDGLHLHVALADSEGRVIGGHLTEGCLVNTTAEVVVESFDDYIFSREFDSNTGYKELVVNKIK